MDSTFSTDCHIRGNEWGITSMEGTPIIGWGTDGRNTVFFQDWAQVERFLRDLQAAVVANHVPAAPPEAPTT